MDKTLVLVPNDKMYFFPYVKHQNITIQSVCRELSSFEMQLMRGIRRLDLPYPMFFGNWKKSLSEYKNVIIFDMCFTPSLVKYIIAHSDAKVYVYLWNPIKNNKKMLGYVMKTQKFAKIFSYDKDDCEKYHMSFAPMMYSSDLKKNSAPITADLAFLGYAKDRVPQLQQYFKEFTEAGLKCNFYVVGSHCDCDSVDGFTVSQRGLSYQEYLKMIESSNAILDLVQGGQSGLSLRVLESVFLEKKLVTGNVRVKEYDLYRPENIFVLENHNIEQIKDFFAEPYVPIEKDILKKYDFANWIKQYFV